MTLKNHNKTKKKNKKKIVIGILTSPISKQFDHIARSYLYKSYVQWAKLYGAKVIPLQYNLPKHILRILLKQINGVIMIGGSVPNLKKYNYETYKHYIGTSHFILEYAKNENKHKNYYPIFSICLGFEILGVLSQYDSVKKAGDKFLERTAIDNIKNYGAGKLYFTDNKTKMKSIFSKNEINLLREKPCVYYHHKMSFDLNKPYINKIKKDYTIVSTDKKQDIEYPTAFESKKFPFYATLYHPEKPLFIHKKGMPKGKAVEIVSNKLSLFFFNECKKNKNKWIGGDKETDFFIKNYTLHENKKNTRKKYVDTPTYIFGEKDKYYV